MRREVWRGTPYGAIAAIVVQDDGDLLALYVPSGSPVRFTEAARLDFFGVPHPWSVRDSWYGHGVLQLHRPGELHSVWAFWRGPERRFSAWYVNIQEAFRRTAIGIDTQDLDLDVVVSPDGSWRLKDDDMLEPMVERGRHTAAEVAAIRGEGARITSELDAGRRWWSDEWAAWEPDPAWPLPPIPEGWETVPASQP